MIRLYVDWPFNCYVILSFELGIDRTIICWKLFESLNLVNSKILIMLFSREKVALVKVFISHLNCCDAGHDNPQYVTENRRRAMEKINFPLTSMISLKMVHGNAVAIVDESWDNMDILEADAVITKQKHVVLAADSADCPIVLLADEQAAIIGLVHAGWKSAKLNILEKTIEQMILLGANQNNISAVIGPCIAKTSYEVSPEFYQQFLVDSGDNHIYFSPSQKQGHFMFDLLQFVKDKLIRLTLKTITAIDLDTYTNEEFFFSCRRSFHRGDSDFGGHLSCIYFAQQTS